MRCQPTLRLWIAGADYHRIRNHSTLRAEQLREVCGWFHIDRRNRVVPHVLNNRTSEIGRFKLFRRDVLKPTRKGMTWVLFHSHPLNDAMPSASDADMPNSGSFLLIYLDLSEALRLRKKAANGLVPCDLKVLRK